MKKRIIDLIDKSQEFVKNNKKVLGILAATTVVAASSYHVYKRVKRNKQKLLEEERIKRKQLKTEVNKAVFKDQRVNQEQNNIQTISKSSQTFSNIHEVKCSQYNIVFDFNDNTNVISISVNYHFKVIKETNQILLDMDRQDILSCCVDGIACEFEIKNEQNDKEYKQSNGLNQSCLRVQLPGFAQEGGVVELTVNMLSRKIDNPHVNWKSNPESNSNSFISSGQGNYSIFPCQNDLSILSTFNLTATMKSHLTLLTSGTLMTSYQYPPKIQNKANNEIQQYNTFVYESKFATSIHMLPIIIGEIEEIQIGESFVQYLKNTCNLETLKLTFVPKLELQNVHEEINGLNKEYTKIVQYFILPEEVDDPSYITLLQPVQFIPLKYIMEKKNIDSIIYRGILSRQLIDHIHYHPSLYQINQAIIEYLIKLGLSKAQKISGQTINQQDKSLLFFEELQKHCKENAVYNFILSYLNSCGIDYNYIDLDQFNEYEEEENNKSKRDIIKDIYDFENLLQKHLGKNITQKIKLQDYFKFEQ